MAIAKLYEQGRALGEVGAGINIGPNASRILHRLGIAEVLGGSGSYIDPDRDRVAVGRYSGVEPRSNVSMIIDCVEATHPSPH
jgi:2-polyprenyl-6-methoxyphenol hydroxylase-like FAD-dependent oxidoreductase